MKPLIIYVSGAPGSGKTTLARHISKQLNILHLSSDLIHGGVALTRPGHNRGEAIRNIFVPYMVETAKFGISFVVDQVLQKDIAKETVIDRLKDYANVIYIHVQASDPIARYVKNIETNESTDIQSRREFLISRAEFHAQNLENTARVMELDVPTMVVDTNDGYDPSLEEVIGFIKSHLAPR